MATQTERIQSRIDRLAARVQRLRDQMTAMMDRMPEEQNEKMLKQMERTMDRVGIFQAMIAGLQREIEVIELAGGDRQLERNALRAVRQYNRALIVLGNLHRRMVTGPRLERAMARVEEAQQALLAAMPIGGAPPGTPGDPTKPSMLLISRDPHRLTDNPMFQMDFDAFSCMVPHGSPETPDRLRPTFSVFREFRTVDVRMPDGAEVEFWGFVGEDEDGAYPSKIIRVPQGALFHGTMKPRKGTHTIHWHGIEPTAMNDGVGKLSFEVSGEYTYQWHAAEPGHYFYHCHHNTPLHFEYGMVGPLMVDPTPPAGDPLEAGFNVATEPGGYPTGGPGYTLRAGGPFTNAHGDQLERYDVEAIWLVDDVDPRWHEHSHDDGLGCPFGEDAGHNRFDPKYFLISGVPQGRTGCAQTIQVRAGQKLLLRLVCACYTLMTNTFRPATEADANLAANLAVPATGLPGTIIAMDARTLGHGPFMQYSNEVELVPGEMFELTSARRYDILFEPGDEHVGDHVYRGECFKYVDSGPGLRGPKFVGALGIDGVYGLIRVLPREQEAA